MAIPEMQSSALTVFGRLELEAGAEVV